MANGFRRGPIKKPRTDYNREQERAQIDATRLLDNRSYFPIPLWVDAAGQSYLNPLVAPAIPNLFLIRIAAFVTGAGGGDTTLSVELQNGGPPDEIGALVIPAAQPTFEVISIDYVFEAPVPEDAMIAGLTMSIDGGHRQIFATAYFAQIQQGR